MCVCVRARAPSNSYIQVYTNVWLTLFKFVFRTFVCRCRCDCSSVYMMYMFGCVRHVCACDLIEIREMSIFLPSTQPHPDMVTLFKKLSLSDLAPRLRRCGGIYCSAFTGKVSVASEIPNQHEHQGKRTLKSIFKERSTL